MQQTTTKQKSPYRFNIKTRLAELDENDKNRIKMAVKNEFGLSRSTMTRYLNEPRANRISHVPATFLQSFAHHLGLHMQDLFNK